MKEINLPSDNYLFVEIPNDAYNFKQGKIRSGNFIQYQIKSKILTKIGNISLKKIKVEIISTTKDITEEQAESIVDKHPYYQDRWFNWNYKLTENSSLIEKLRPLTFSYSLSTAKESLQSLIQANGLDINKNYLILKML